MKAKVRVPIFFILAILTIIQAIAIVSAETRTISSLPYSIQDTVPEDSYDTYIFTAPYSGSVEAVLTPCTSCDDPDLRVYSGGAEIVCSLRARGEVDRVIFDVVAGHTYEIRVCGFYSASGDTVCYRLEVRYVSTTTTAPTPTPTPTPAPSQNDPYEPNDDMSSARTISVPTTISNLYLTSTDEDWFRFCIGSTSTVTIETFYPGGTSVDTILYLYNSGGSEIDWDDDGGSGLYSKIVRTLSSGCYYIRVRSFGHDSGNYGLRVSLSTSTATPYPTPTPAHTPAPTPTPAPIGVAPPTEGWTAWIWNTINSTIISPITSGIRTIVDTFMQGISSIVNAVFQPIIDGLTYVGQGIVSIFQSIYNAISTAIRSVLFGGAITPLAQATAVPKEVVSAQLQLSTLGYVFVGMVLCVVGVFLILFTSKIPIVNIVTTIIGVTLILLGVLVGLFGIAPDWATNVAVAVFTIIWVVAVIMIIWNEIKAFRKAD